jgi:hypothetical protein
MKDFLFVNADGLYEEAESYETSDFISTSAGAADAGKPIVLDANGQIDGSMIDSADVDHGGLTGLGDDDHTQYHNDARGDARYYQQTEISSTANGEGASLVGIEDAGSYFTATDVEGALQQLAADLAAGQDFVEYTVDTGGVTKGDLVFISGDDTVAPYATLSDAHRGIGLAATTESAAATVKVMANDEIIEGVLAGATAGDTYYWNGTALSTAIPAGGGSHVWQAGVAKNATDLHVEVRFIKKNA